MKSGRRAPVRRRQNAAFVIIFISLLILSGIVPVSAATSGPVVVKAPTVIVPVVVKVCTGLLSVTSTPSGASVFIDTVDQGTTPLKSLRINAGRHAIRVSMAGHIDATETLSVSCNQSYMKQYTLVDITTTTPVSVVGNYCPGLLSVNSTPPGASVFIDSVNLGTTPLTGLRINAGQHAIRVSLAGHVEAADTVSILCDRSYLEQYTLAGITTTTPVPAVVQPASPPAIITVSPTTSPPLVRTTGPSIVPTTGLTYAEHCVKTFTGSGVLSSSGGRTNCTVSVHSDDRIAVLDIPEGTRAHDAENNSLAFVSIASLTTSEIPPLPVEDTSLKLYRCTPDHASFDPPGRISITLSAEEWEASDPQNLTIRETSPDGKSWETLPIILDVAGRTVSAPVTHFSTIGLFTQNTTVTLPPDTAPPDNSINGLIRQAVGSGTARSLPLSFIIPDKIAPLVAVVAGIGLALMGTTVAARTALSPFLEKTEKSLSDYISSSLIGLMSNKEIEKRGIHPSDHGRPLFAGISGRELGVIAISALLFALAFLLRDRLVLDLIIVLVYVGVAIPSVILHDLAHKICARRCGCATDYQFWLLGTAIMLLTAGLLGNVFAKPSRTVIGSDTKTGAEMNALIRMAGPLVSLGIACLSLFLIPFGGVFAIVGSAGFTINLVGCVYALIPVTPMDGRDVYTWNKLVWAAVFIPLLVFYLYVYLQA